MFDWLGKKRFSTATDATGDVLKAEYRDGRSWHPLDVTDGRPRLMLTVDTSVTLEDGSNPVHVDMFNGVEWENVGELALIAQRTASSHIQQKMGATNGPRSTGRQGESAPRAAAEPRRGDDGISRN